MFTHTIPGPPPAAGACDDVLAAEGEVRVGAGLGVIAGVVGRDWVAAGAVLFEGADDAAGAVVVGAEDPVANQV